MAKQTETKQPATETEDANSTDAMMKTIAADEFAGQGGSYIYDPATGKRTRVPDEPLK
jgi:hypothetical protein